MTLFLEEAPVSYLKLTLFFNFFIDHRDEWIGWGNEWIPIVCWQELSALQHWQIVQQMGMAYTFYLLHSSCVDHSHLVEIKVYAHLQFFVPWAPQRFPEDSQVYIFVRLSYAEFDLWTAWNQLLCSKLIIDKH